MNQRFKHNAENGLQKGDEQEISRPFLLKYFAGALDQASATTAFLRRSHPGEGVVVLLLGRLRLSWLLLRGILGKLGGSRVLWVLRVRGLLLRKAWIHLKER